MFINLMRKLIKKQTALLDKEKKKDNGLANLPLPILKSIRILNEFIIARYGSEEEAKIKLEEFMIDGVFSDTSFRALYKDMYLDKLFLIFKPFLQAKGIISLIGDFEKNQQRIEPLIRSMSIEEIIIFYSVLDRYMKCYRNINQEIFKDVFYESNLDLKELDDFLGIKLNFSKKEIAADFSVSKETLNAWLRVFYEDTYKNVRKISLEEYIDIIAKFTTEDPSELKSDKYVSRIMNGVVLKKIELAEIDGCDPKTLQNNLKHKFPIYKEMDKFPYSMAKEFLDHIGTDIDDRDLSI